MTLMGYYRVGCHCCIHITFACVCVHFVCGTFVVIDIVACWAFGGGGGCVGFFFFFWGGGFVVVVCCCCCWGFFGGFVEFVFFFVFFGLMWLLLFCWCCFCWGVGVCFVGVFPLGLSLFLYVILFSLNIHSLDSTFDVNR